MGKKKKTYVRPEMKIIEVKTEGVIAASSGGGEIEVPIGNITTLCEKNSIFNNSCGAPQPKIQNCEILSKLGAGSYNTCLNQDAGLRDINGNLITWTKLTITIKPGSTSYTVREGHHAQENN